MNVHSNTDLEETHKHSSSMKTSETSKPDRAGPDNVRRGQWSPEEDRKLVDIIALHGPLNWVRISLSIKTRSPKQCRERYHQNLKPLLNRNPITHNEGVLIDQLVMKHGKKWTAIARHLPGRSDNAIKNWWNRGANRRRRASFPHARLLPGEVLRALPLALILLPQPAVPETQQLNGLYPGAYAPNDSSKKSGMIFPSLTRNHSAYMVCTDAGGGAGTSTHTPQTFQALPLHHHSMLPPAFHCAGHAELSPAPRCMVADLSPTYTQVVPQSFVKLPSMPPVAFNTGICHNVSPRTTTAHNHTSKQSSIDLANSRLRSLDHVSYHGRTNSFAPSSSVSMLPALCSVGPPHAGNSYGDSNSIKRYDSWGSGNTFTNTNDSLGHYNYSGQSHFVASRLSLSSTPTLRWLSFTHETHETSNTEGQTADDLACKRGSHSGRNLVTHPRPYCAPPSQAYTQVEHFVAPPFQQLVKSINLSPPQNTNQDPTATLGFRG